MWELCLLANNNIGQQSAKDMVNHNCTCPGYILSKENVDTIQLELKNKLKVSLILLDRISQERYEGQVDTVKGTGREANNQTRWNIKGKVMQPVLFRDEDNINYAGVRFRWI
jgi:hypothetical protein